MCNLFFPETPSQILLNLHSVTKLENLGYFATAPTKDLRIASSPSNCIGERSMSYCERFTEFQVEDSLGYSILLSMKNKYYAKCAVDLETLFCTMLHAALPKTQSLSTIQVETLCGIMVEKIHSFAASEKITITDADASVLEQGMKHLMWFKFRGVSSASSTSTDLFKIDDTIQHELIDNLKYHDFQIAMTHLESYYETFSKQLDTMTEPVSDRYRHHDQVAALLREALIGPNSTIQTIIDSKPCSAHKRHFSYLKEQISSFIETISRYKKSQLSLAQSIESSANPYLKKLPIQAAWQLFLVSDYDLPRYPYVVDAGSDKNNSREAGYISSMMNAFSEFLPKNEKKFPVSSAGIIALHKVALFGVSNVNNPQVQMGETDAHLPLSKTTSTEAGLQELRDKIQGGVLQGWVRIRTPDQIEAQYGGEIDFNGLFLNREVHSPDACIKQLDRLVGDYNSNMEKSKSSEDRFVAIVSLAQNLEQAHIFSDGNTRVSSILLLNILLIQEGLPPAMWGDSHVLDAHSLSECCQEVKACQERYLTFLETVEDVT